MRILKIDLWVINHLQKGTFRRNCNCPRTIQITNSISGLAGSLRLNAVQNEGS